MKVLRLLFYRLMNEEERNTFAICGGLILLIFAPAIALGLLGFGYLEYITAILIILVIGMIFFGYNAFLK